MLKKYYLGGFFGRLYRTNGVKTGLGSPLHIHNNNICIFMLYF